MKKMLKRIICLIFFHLFFFGSVYFHLKLWFSNFKLLRPRWMAARSLARFESKVGFDRKTENSVDSTWKLENSRFCGRTWLCIQIEQESLRSFEKPDSVITSSSFVFRKFMHYKHSQPSDPSLNWQVRVQRSCFSIRALDPVP